MATSSFRQGIILGLGVFAAACGGDNGTGPDPAGEPASLAIHAGNNQTAPVGTAVAVNPAVVVRDGDGRVVAGVRVNFAIEAGGGAIGVAGVNTDQNGVASPGQWVLGPNPGPQALAATVSGLPKVTITATAVPGGGGGGEEIVTQTVTGSGGSITVSKAGSPLNGARLTFEAGALAGSTPVTLSEVPASSFAIPAGMTALTPGLGIAGTAGRMGAGATVTFPATPAAGKVLMVGYADPATRKVILLPTIHQDGTSITALLPSLDATGIAGAHVAGSFTSGARNDPKSVTMLLSINEELLSRDFDSGFRPGVDDWDFPRMPVADLAFLRRPGETATDFAVADDGMVTTAIWYYVNRRKAGGPPLNGSQQLFPQQPLSSRYGIRWAALAERDVPSINQTGGLVIREWNEWATDDRGRFMWLQFQGIKALMLTTFERPVPVVLLETDQPDEFNAEAHPMAIAYRTTGNTLHLAWAGAPGQEIRVDFSEQGMVPFTLPNPNGTARVVRAIAGIHYVNVIDDAKLASQWARVANQTIGDAEGWPRPKLHWEKAELDTARVFLLDELQQWWQCSACPEKVSRPSQLPQTASHVQRFQSVSMSGGGSANLSASFSSARLKAADTFEEGENQSRYGFVIQHPVREESWVGIQIGWLDWTTAVYRKLELEPSVAAIEVNRDTTVTVSVTPSETPPSGTSYRWIMKDSESVDSTETTGPSHSRDIEAETTGWLVVEALEGQHKRPIARDSIEIKSGGSVPAWRILTLGDPDEMFDEAQASGNEALLLQRLIQVPTSGLIVIEEIEGEKVLRLRVRRSGVWSQADSVIPAFNAAAERVMPLGFSPARPHAVGPFFSDWFSSRWSQSSESLDAGTISGHYAMGLASYPIKNGGTQTGPAGGVRIDAVRSGTSMVGEMRIYIWFIDEDTDQVEEGPDIYRLPFTAVRLK